MVENQLQLHLRLNGTLFYESPRGSDPNKGVEHLFEMAAAKVFEATEPYLSTAALVGTDPDRALWLARQFIAECEPPGKAANCPDRQIARWYNLVAAILHYSKYDRTKAQSAYDRAIEKDARFAIAHSNLAGLLKEQGEREKAEIPYQKAIESDPDFAAARFNLAIMLRGRPDRAREAEAELNRAMALYRRAASAQSSANAHIDFGYALVADGRYEPERLREEQKYNEAVQEFRRAVDRDPQNAAAHNGLGKALDQLSEALPNRPDESKICLRDQAVLAARQSRACLRDQAVDAFRQVIALNPLHAYAYYNLGIVLRRRNGPGDNEAAKVAFHNALLQHQMSVELDPH